MDIKVKAKRYRLLSPIALLILLLTIGLILVFILRPLYLRRHQTMLVKNAMQEILYLMQENKTLFVSLSQQESSLPTLGDAISTTSDRLKQNNQAIQSKLTSITNKDYEYMSKTDQEIFSNLRKDTLDSIVLQRKLIDDMANFYLVTSPVYSYDSGPVYHNLSYSTDLQTIRDESSLVTGGALGISNLLEEYQSPYLDESKIRSLAIAYSNYSNIFKRLQNSSSEIEYDSNLSETYSETIKLRQQTYETLVSGLQSEIGTTYLTKHISLINRYLNFIQNR